VKAATEGGRGRDRLLLALVATFAPARARPLLSGLGGSDSEGLQAEGTLLASLPRKERLLALAAALEEAGGDASATRSALLAGERPPARSALAGWVRTGERPEASVRPALRRLVEERL
jgi:hypothetical protein